MRRAILALLCVSLSAALATGAQAEKRVALVIGNGAYANATQLPNPHDAEDVAAALKRDGFETIVGIDLDQAKMQENAIAFARAARDADVALFYYSGHAMQFAGVNYLMPVDAKLTDEADLRRMARVDDIMADLQQARALRILILDACRDNPFAEQLKRSIGLTRAASLQRGLARIDAPQGTIVAFSTQAEQTAADGTGRNSPYTAAFLRHVSEPEEIGLLFRHVSADVYEATGHKQLPELSLSLIGEYYLRPPQASSVPTSAAAPLPNPAAPPVPGPSKDPATTAWDAVKDSDSEAALEDFIAKYGNDPIFGMLANARLTELRIKHGGKGAEVMPPEEPEPPKTVAPATVTIPNPAPSVEHKPGESFKDCESCPEMVAVPAGTFNMGSPAGEKNRSDNEGPQHEVNIAAPFAIGKFEVTKDQFEAFVTDSGYAVGPDCFVYRPNSPDLPEWRQGASFRDPGFAQQGNDPAVCISFADTSAYAAWLAKKTGKTYRLPTEAEWEYAARAGSNLRLASAASEADLCRYANGGDLANRKGLKDTAYAINCSDGFIYTAPIGSFAPNGFGLYDMLGNAREWTLDCAHFDYKGAPKDGSAWTAGGDCSHHVSRGGSWVYSHQRGLLRPATRYIVTSDRVNDVGFRVMRSLTP